MFSSMLFLLAASAGYTSVACTPRARLAACEQGVYAYNAEPLGASAKPFNEIPYAAL